ncbi:midasin [Dorcoceras hygrometricum]|uniref:Midasin n=1 Tax=Dorcoceras hygrometricum TaxID=472368 RepID=A0A2Z7D4V2_9LAMI|nr:midasin [Dorcoceras hygrometricum]
MQLTGFDLWVPSPFDVDNFQKSYRLDFDFIGLIMFIRWIESTVLNFGEEMQNVSSWIRTVNV